MDKHTLDWTQQLSAQARQLWHHWTRNERKVIITGLSRSGKTVFFTSLIYLLKARAAQGTGDDLPLLHRRLAKDNLVEVEVSDLPDAPSFPYQAAIEALQSGQWPAATEQISGFELVIHAHNRHPLTRRLKPIETLALQFYDYPGEWLTDLPMLNKDYLNWSNQVMAEQHSLPLKLFSGAWIAAIESTDFSQPPSHDTLQQLHKVYHDYLMQAKAGGITLLQPAGLLLDTTNFDFNQQPVFPLPSHIACESGHPWTQRLTAHFLAYQEQWLRPLQVQYFSRAEQQVVLVDLFEGLNYGQNQLRQLRQTLSQLATTFVYGRTHWLKKFLGRAPEISKVAFAATKMDCAPFNQQANLLALLKDVTAGAQNQFAPDEVSFAHFCVSALRVTKQEDEDADAILYQNPDGQVVRMHFSPIPGSVSEMGQTQALTPIETQPGRHWQAQIRASQGLDGLLNYLLGEDA